MSWKMLLFFAVASFFAWPLLFAGVSQRRESRRRNEQERSRTTGTIVEYVVKSGATGGYRPVIEFTADGERLRLEYENPTNREQYPVGAAVDVMYDVSNPSHFHLESDPVFARGGAGAIRIALIWIIASAALTVALAVLVGGARFDFEYLWYRIRMALRRR